TLKNAWTTSRQVNFFWVANFNLKFGSNNFFFSAFAVYGIIVTGTKNITSTIFLNSHYLFVK
ncbi:hypothetical protein ACJBYS_09640, partial [Streptococcus suis]